MVSRGGDRARNPRTKPNSGATPGYAERCDGLKATAKKCRSSRACFAAISENYRFLPVLENRLRTRCWRRRELRSGVSAGSEMVREGMMNDRISDFKFPISDFRFEI